MTRFIAVLAMICNAPLLLSAQQTVQRADTTSSGYKIGYTIGEWLPFILLIVLVLMVMFRARKLSKD